MRTGWKERICVKCDGPVSENAGERQELMSDVKREDEDRREGEDIQCQM
jgi:hypothetical protein